MSGNPRNDIDNPDWTAEDFARAVGPEALSDAELAAFPKTRGRPKLASPKLPVSLRLSQEVVMRFRASGPGWQSRIDAALSETYISPEMEDLVRAQKALVEDMIVQIRAMRDGALGSGAKDSDVTDDVIKVLQLRRDELERVYQRYGLNRERVTA